jgi:hypothetical protein
VVDNKVITLIIRETGWTLDYIRAQPVSTLFALVNEIAYQRAVEDYRQDCRSASVMTTMINLWAKKQVSVDEIIGQPPERRNMEDDKTLAKGVELVRLTLADGQEYELAPMTLNVMMAVEEKFDKSYFDLVNSRRLSHIRYIVWLRLKGKYPELTEEKVGELVTVSVLTEIAKLYGVE